MKRSLIGALLSLALFSSAPASAQVTPSCKSVDLDLEEFTGAGGVKHQFLEGEDKKRGIAYFNAAVPGVEVDAVFVGLFGNGSGALAWGVNGEICFRAMFAPDEFRQTLAKILGAAI